MSACGSGAKSKGLDYFKNLYGQDGSDPLRPEDQIQEMIRNGRSAADILPMLQGLGYDGIKNVLQQNPQLTQALSPAFGSVGAVR